MLVLVFESLEEELRLQGEIGDVDTEQEIVHRSHSQRKPHEQSTVAAENKLHVSADLLWRSVPLVESLDHEERVQSWTPEMGCLRTYG